MLDLGLPRLLGIATLTLAATLHAGSAHADPPAAPVAPAAAPAPVSPPAAPAMGHVYAPPVDLGPPVYRAPPGYGWPPGSSPAEEPPDVEYPQEMRARSSGMVAGGVVLLSFGVAGLIAGSTLVGAHVPTSDQSFTEPCCTDGGSVSPITPPAEVDPGLKKAGIATLVGSVAALGAGTAFLIYGAKQVPFEDGATPRSALLMPTVRVGPAGATLRWQF